MRLYAMSEHCTQSGLILTLDQDDREVVDAEGYPISDDLFLWGEGTKALLIMLARARIERRKDTRPGGSEDAFEHKCARNVIEYLAE